MKTKRKFIPVSLYDIPGLEHWLEEQANLGLFPVGLSEWATFTPTGVPGTRFRLDPFANRMGEGTEPTQEKLELYEAAGWKYAFPIGQAYFLFYTTDPAAPELYTDWESRGLSLDRLAEQIRRAKRSQFLPPIAIFLPLLVLLFLPASRFDVQPDRFTRLPLVLLYLFNPFLLLFIALFCYQTPIQLRDYRTLLATHENLKEGLPPPPSPGPSKRIVREHMVSVLLVPVLLLVLVGGRMLERTVPVEEFTAPYVSLRDMESVPLGPYETIIRKNSGLSSENVAKRQFTLLAPAWYEVSQNLDALQPGRRPGSFSPDPRGGEYTYSPNLDMTYVHTLPLLARPVARSQMDVYRLVNLRWTYEEVDHPGTDFVILANEVDGPWQMAALAKGGRVAVFRYAGKEDLADHLDLLAAMVAP